MVESKSYTLEKPLNPNVPVGLMQQKDEVDYVPFFSLCERNERVQTCSKCDREYSYENQDCEKCSNYMSKFFKSIKMMVDKISDADERHTMISEKHKNHHW